MEPVRTGRLGVFVSGIGRLVDERNAIVKAVETVGLDPVAFENWGARPVSTENTYIEELRSSDIYVGVFGTEWSEATNMEFREATALRFPRLVYVRRRDTVRDRDKKLTEFITELQNPQEGLKYRQFSHSLELESQVVEDLADLLSKQFRLARTRMPQSPYQTQVAHVSERGEIRFGAKVEVEKLKAGESLYISVTFTADVVNGLLTAQVIHKEVGLNFWAPCKETHSPYLDLGLLQGHFEDQTFTWELRIPPWFPLGTLIVVPGLWEDPLGLPERGRHSLRIEQLELQLEEGEDRLVTQIQLAYRKILGREPDHMGVSDWYRAVKSHRITLGRMVIDGFLKSVEFRFGKVLSLLGITMPDEDAVRWIKAIQEGESSLDQVIAHAHSITSAENQLPENLRDLVREIFTGAMGREPIEQELTKMTTDITPDVGPPVPFIVGRLLNSNEFLARELVRSFTGEYPSDNELATYVEMLKNDDPSVYAAVEEFAVDQLADT